MLQGRKEDTRSAFAALNRSQQHWQTDMHGLLLREPSLGLLYTKQKVPVCFVPCSKHVCNDWYLTQIDRFPYVSV